MSRSCLGLAAVLFALTLTPVAAAQQPAAEDRDTRITDLERQMSALQGAYGELLELTRDLTDQLRAAREGGVDDFYIPRQQPDAPTSQMPVQYGGIYTKPFLTGEHDRVKIGGYIDLEFFDPSGSGNKAFDQHRLVPFIYADVSESVNVAAEIEIEHGFELEVEFAQMDFLLNDHFNLRAGIQLLPLGKFNEVHDSPLQELTFRPLVDRYIIPTTLRDAGLGAFGEINDELSYQATVSNGFRGLENDGTNAITSTDGLRNAAPQSDDLGEPFENQNNELAYTGRVAYTPILGVETGVSALFDTYDEAGDNDLRIFALDATVHGAAVPLLPDNMELLYEGAWADVHRNAFARASGVVGDMEGYYVQANVHFTPEFLADYTDPGGLVEEGAHFTFVTRYGVVDLDDYGMRRTTLGLNFRPNEDRTVFKLDYQFNEDHGSASGTNDDNAWVMSVATYF